MITRKTNLPLPAGTPATDTVLDGMMLALWRQGFDTFDIAAKLGLRESQVANDLPRLRRAA